ncbi:MAG: hypothetical protein ABIT23_03035 [Nitrosospira sp.]
MILPATRLGWRSVDSLLCQPRSEGNQPFASLPLSSMGHPFPEATTGRRHAPCL